MKKYRILEEDGLFYPQRRYWFVFWENCLHFYVPQTRGYTPIDKPYFDTIEEAQHYINNRKVKNTASKFQYKKIHYVD